MAIHLYILLLVVELIAIYNKLVITDKNKIVYE